jgi:biopolymer transport protein ExbB/TolQ
MMIIWLMMVSIAMLFIGLSLNAWRYVNRQKNKKAAYRNLKKQVDGMTGTAKVQERKSLVADMKANHANSTRRERRAAAAEVQRRMKRRIAMEARS